MHELLSTRDHLSIQELHRMWGEDGYGFTDWQSLLDSISCGHIQCCLSKPKPRARSKLFDALNQGGFKAGIKKEGEIVIDELPDFYPIKVTRISKVYKEQAYPEISHYEAEVELDDDRYLLHASKSLCTSVELDHLFVAKVERERMEVEFSKANAHFLVGGIDEYTKHSKLLALGIEEMKRRLAADKQVSILNEVKSFAKKHGLTEVKAKAVLTVFVPDSLKSRQAK